MRTEEWVPVAERDPPRGVVVDTKIDDAQGVRNEQPLKLGERGRLWWIASGEMYVYYSPTHWRHRQETNHAD